jgi:hypothetical protein
MAAGSRSGLASDPTLYGLAKAFGVSRLDL